MDEHTVAWVTYLVFLGAIFVIALVLSVQFWGCLTEQIKFVAKWGGPRR